MGDRMERVWSLVAVLRHANRPLTFADVRDRLGEHHYPDGDAGRARFEADKKLLRDEGVEIATDIPEGEEGRTTYRIVDHPLPDLGLTDAERTALELAAAAVRFDDATWVRDAAWKLGGTDADAPLAVTLETHDALAALFEAIRLRAPVTFDYRGAGDPEPRTRTVEPHGLGTREGYWYLTLRDPDDGLTKHFRVDRIAGAVSSGEPGTVERPAGVDPAATVPERWDVGEDDPIEVTVRIGPVFAEAVRHELGEHRVVATATDDDDVLATVTVRDLGVLRSWVLGMLDHAEVVAPPEAREEMARWLAEVAGA